MPWGCREAFFFTHKGPVHLYERGLATHQLCRSELAREKLENDAGCQASRVIVDDHREQARSYIDQKWKLVLSNAVRPAA